MKSIFEAYKTRSNAGDFIVTSLLLLYDEKYQGSIRQALENYSFDAKFVASLNSAGNFFYIHWVFSCFLQCVDA